MKRISLLLTSVVVCLFVSASANGQTFQTQDPVANISAELTNISKSVQTMNDRLKAFLDKFSAVGGATYTEKQQRLLLGLEFLVRNEQRLATLQRFQIELVEKQVSVRTRLAQVEVDLKSQSIDRTVAFAGTTQTEELRDSRRQTLQAERTSLQTLLSQIQTSLNDTTAQLREVQMLVQRLRQQLLFQVEKEVSDL
jgi:hypothetical protein